MSDQSHKKTDWMISHQVYTHLTQGMILSGLRRHGWMNLQKRIQLNLLNTKHIV